MSPLNLRPLIEGAMVVLGLLGITWGMVVVGTARPHPESITRAEMALIQELIRSENAAMRREIQSLQELILLTVPDQNTRPR